MNDEMVKTQPNPEKKKTIATTRQEHKSTRATKEGGMKTEGQSPASATAREKFPRSENF